MTEDNFKAKIKKVTDSRTHKITDSLGVYDAYKWIRKNKWLDIGTNLTEKEFYSIIRLMNNYIAKSLSDGSDFTLPEKMGRLEIRKHKTSVTFENGKLKTNLPIDWNRTLELWYNDKYSRDNKKLVRVENKEVFRVYYNKFNANYNNKTFYHFRPSRGLKQSIKHNVINNNLDAFLI